MYSLILGGGLGNQMFQYAYARYLSLEYAIDFSFNLYNYNVHNTEIEERKFSLNNFNIINKQQIESKELSIRNYKKYKAIYRTTLPIRKILKNEASYQLLANMGCLCTINNVLSYYPVKLKKTSGIIYGGFQSEKYFCKYSNKIMEELKVNSEIAKKNIKIYNKIKKTNSVAVHIRRGDYLNKKYANLNVCTKKYYESSIKYFIKNEIDPVFFVFSNCHEDILWIKENYDFLPENTIYIDNNNKDYEDLQLMYNCKHFIISNSTFSWWAQYLSDNTNKKVIAPNKWFVNQKSKPDIYQRNWIIKEI